MASSAPVTPNDRRAENGAKTVKSPIKGPIKGPIVECMVCHILISQKSIKTHFIGRHPEHDYEEQKKFYAEKKLKSVSASKIGEKKSVSPKTPVESTLPDRLTNERPDIVVACVVCYEMMSTKSMKGHFIRKHPDHNYESLKATMCSMAQRSNNEMITCSACRKAVSSRTLKVHILKNHPGLDYKATLKDSRADAAKNGSPAASPMKSQKSLLDSGARYCSRNELYPCVVCQKEVIFQNMKKHFRRKHPDEIYRYDEMKIQRSALRESVKSQSSVNGTKSEVNNNSDEEFAPSALLKEIEEKMAEEYGMDPYTHLLGRRNGLHVQVTEQVIRFDHDGREEFTEINPPSSKVVPLDSPGGSSDLGESSRKRRLSEDDENDKNPDMYKRLAAENFLLERQILYLQEQEQFLERKMLAYQRVMEKKMREFEEKLRAEFEERSRQLMVEVQLREEKMKLKVVEQDRWLMKRLEEQRKMLADDSGQVAPSTADNGSEKSAKSWEDDSRGQTDNIPLLTRATKHRAEPARSEKPVTRTSAKTPVTSAFRKSARKLKPKLMIKLKSKMSAEKRKQYCEPCGQMFRDNWDMKKHLKTLKHKEAVEMKQKEGEASEYGCLTCGLDFTSSEQMKTHLVEGCDMPPPLSPSM